MLKIFVLGVLVGWQIEWIIDWLWWRRADPAAVFPATVMVSPAAATVSSAAAMVSPAAPMAPSASPGMAQVAGVASADTSAGAVAAQIAVGAPGAVSTSSATLSSHAPVFRQVDLEAIPGLGPATAAMLRQHGITTFAQLAQTSNATFAQILARDRDLASDKPAGGDLAGGDLAGAHRFSEWRLRAALAAAGDWSGFAARAGAGDA